MVSSILVYYQCSWILLSFSPWKLMFNGMQFLTKKNVLIGSTMATNFSILETDFSLNSRILMKLQYILYSIQFKMLWNLWTQLHVQVEYVTFLMRNICNSFTGQFKQWPHGETPLDFLDNASHCFACAIKGKPKDAALHMKLGQVLEERYYAEDLFGLKKEVNSMILCFMVYPIF